MVAVYNAKYPIEFFDFIIIDECHRSIYNIWKQVLDYFDAFQIGKFRPWSQVSDHMPLFMNVKDQAYLRA